MTNTLDVRAITRGLEKRFSSSEAVVLYDSLIVRLAEDGTISRRYHRRIVLFTDDAIRRYGDPRVLYNSDKQTLDIEVARVYMRDGTVVDTEDNGKNLTTPFSIARAPDYTSWQEMVITHVGIEKGCIAELCYTIRDREKLSDALSGFFVFNEDDPALERVLEVDVPVGVELKHLELNGAASPRVSEDGRRFVWTMTDLPCKPSGNGFAWYGDYLPVVYYSTEKGWDAIAARIGAWFGEAVDECKYKDKLVGKEEEQLGNAELVLYLQKKSVEAVRSVDVPYEVLSSKPRKADRIFQSGYACIFDRAVLLGALLKAEGFQPYPVLVSKGNTFYEDVPAANLFDKLLVAVPLDDRVLLLDPERKFKRDPSVSQYGKTFFHCTVPARFERAWERLGMDSNIDRLSLKMSFDGDDMVCRGMAEMAGIFSPYWSVEGSDGELRRYLEETLGQIFGKVELEEWNLARLEPGSVQVGFSFEVQSFLPAGDSRAYIDLPVPFESNLSGIEAIELGVSSVRAPFYVVPGELRVDIELEIPKGWRLVAFPGEVKEENEFGVLNVSSRSFGGERIEIARELRIKSDRVIPEIYPDFRRMILSLTKSRVVLSRM